MTDIESRIPQFVKFADFHVKLNAYIKLSTASIDYLTAAKSTDDELTDLLDNLIRNAGERWVGTIYADPFGELKKLKIQLTESAIMRVFSSFDVFIDEINGYFSEFKVEIAPNTGPESCNKFQLMFKKFEWPYEELEYLIPAYNFYVEARHCIVHRMGVANANLKAINTSQAFIDSIEFWPTVTPGRKLSAPPAIDGNGNLILNPHHAISYSDICFRIAKIINRNIIDKVGIDYFVLKTAKEYLIDKNEIIGFSCNNVHAYIKFHIRNNYGFSSLEISDIKAILDKNDLRKKYAARYSLLVRKESSSTK